MSIDLSDTFYGDPLTGGATSDFGADLKPYGITSVGQLHMALLRSPVILMSGKSTE